MSGFVLLHRDLIGNPQFRGKDDEYAAIWIIANAAWEPTTVRVAGKLVSLDRGQLCFSVSFLAQAWECSKATAHSRLRHFEKNGFIRTEVRTGLTVITVCKYTEYQPSPNDARTHDQTSPERSPNAPRTKKNEGNENIGGGGGGAHPRETDLPDTDPDATSGTDPFHPDARTVVARFHDLRRDLWPTEAKLPAPDMTLLTQAADYLQGAPLALVLDVVERGMRTAAAENRPSTHSLKAFCRSMANAAVTYRQSIGGANGTDHHSRTRPSRRPGYDPDESRRRTLEVFPDIVGGDFGGAS